jgi:hypothetical protein
MNGKKWSKAQREKFAATLAAKAKASRGVASGVARKRITRNRDISLTKIGPGLYLLKFKG